MIASYFFARFLANYASKELGAKTFKVIRKHPDSEDSVMFSSSSQEEAEKYLYFLNNNLIRHDKNFTYCIIEDL